MFKKTLISTGRWFEFSKLPLTICDTGHNQPGLEKVFEQLNEFPQRKHIVLGFVQEKNIDEVLKFYLKKCYLLFREARNI